ncbi:hypothetical protein Acr_18g0002700 [Actinidia rufa]|uniref:Uncharacterized protein n=1 Tax=Actinidia rufa TaxID=165716 RepID=A0A7J0G5N6_9ERIC|nr:hypothetical protein Acr_18g0002700 [Actinidia rufa]
MERWWVAHRVAAHKAGAEVSPSIRLGPRAGQPLRIAPGGSQWWNQTMMENTFADFFYPSSTHLSVSQHFVLPLPQWLLTTFATLSSGPFATSIQLFASLNSYTSLARGKSYPLSCSLILFNPLSFKVLRSDLEKEVVVGWQGGESRRGFLVVARWKWWSRERGVTESVFDTGGWGMDWEAMVVGTARG